MRCYLPIFTSHFSLGRSILTLDKPNTPIDNADPVSILSISKQYELPEVFLVESSMTGFLSTYYKARDEGIKLRFGYRVTVCSDIKEEDNEYTESQVIIWMKQAEDNQAYKDLINLTTLASVDGFNKKPRLDWKLLNKHITNNLFVTIPFYNGFIARNLLYRCQCVPQFKNFKPYLHLQNKGLPFDYLIERQVKKYAKNFGLDVLPVHTVYYYAKEDVEAYLTYRTVFKRSKINKPNIDHFSSDEFSFESWLEKEGRAL